MKIKQELYRNRNDFTAILECEHCGNEEKLTSGYHDYYYHNNVLPALHCNKCGLDRKGTKNE